MNITGVREVVGDEVKGKVAIEKELLEQAQAEQQALAKPIVDVVVEEAPPELDENAVLSHINKKYQKGYTSFDEILAPQVIEKEVELPEDVAGFFKYKKDTNRGLNDYVRTQRNFEEEDPKKVMAEYMAIKNPELDADDIAYDIREKFDYDEDLDDEKDVRSKKIAMKKELSEAIAYFNTQKEQYKVPVVSAVNNVPNEDKDGYEAYKEEVSRRKSDMDKGKVLSDYFVQKTNELFDNNFKGFDFNVGDKSFTYSPNDSEKLKQSQINVGNFVNSHLNEEGYLKDAGAYHKSLAVAMNPDLFAKHFYEQGKADAIASQAISDKNINMGSIRNAPNVAKQTEGITMRALDESHGSSLKIPSRK